MIQCGSHQGDIKFIWNSTRIKVVGVWGISVTVLHIPIRRLANWIDTLEETKSHENIFLLCRCLFYQRSNLSLGLSVCASVGKSLLTLLFTYFYSAAVFWLKGREATSSIGTVDLRSNVKMLATHCLVLRMTVEDDEPIKCFLSSTTF